MSKHTPGPWSELTGTIIGPNGDEIAEVVGGDGGRYLDDDVNAECAANARLITAAPELLEALRALLSVVEFAIDRNDGDMFGIRHNDAMDAIGEASSAIAKATAD